MREVTFDRDRSKRMLLDLLETQRAALKAGEEPDDLVTLAGVALAAGSLCATMMNLEERKRADRPAHREHVELECERSFDDNLAAVRFIADLTIMLWCGEYDDFCEPTIRARVEADPENRSAVLPVEGFHDRPDSPWYQALPDAGG